MKWRMFSFMVSPKGDEEDMIESLGLLIQSAIDTGKYQSIRITIEKSNA